MAKAIKTAIIAAAIVITGGALAVGLTAGTAAAISMASVYSAAAMTFATTLVAAGIGQLTSKGINASNANFGTKFATRASSAPRQIVYGKCRVGGTILHIETTGTDNFLLHMVVGVAGHEIEDIETIRLNDTDLTSTTGTVNGITVNEVTSPAYVNTENDNAFASGRLIRFTKRLGTADQSVDPFLNDQLASIGTSDRFRNIAYVYIQMVFDAEKFGGGLPAFSFIVKGKKVYDPRNSQTAWSTNPALIIRDYLTDTVYGLKATNSEINDSTSAGGFAAAANICDQNAILSDGSSTETRYTANGFTNMSANGEGVLEALLSSCAGKMSYTNGKFNMFAGAAQTPSLTITDDDLLEPVNVATNARGGDFYNTVKGIYVDESNDFVATESPVFQDSTFLAEDTPTGESSANYVKTLEVQYPFTTSESMAQRLGRITLNANRQSTTLSMLTTTKYMRLQPNDWVYVTNERLGYTNKVFEVVSMNLEVIGDDVPIVATRLSLKEASSSVFTFASGNYETPIAEGSTVSTGTYAISAPSSLSASVTTNNSFSINTKNVALTWTNNANQVVNGTEIQYKLSSDSTYIDAAIVARDITKYTIIGLEVGKTYNIRIRHISTFNTYSAYVTVNASTGGTAYTALEDGATVGAKLGTNLKDSSNNTLGDSDVITNQGTAANITNQGNLATLDTVNTAQLVDDAITNAKIAVNAIQGDVIAAGAIVEAKLGVDAVTSAKIAANAVNTSEIATGAITANEIASNAVTANKIIANAVSTDKLAANAVTAAKIAANTITASQIAAGTITATEIASGTITASQINVSTLAVQKFDNVTAQIVNHNSNAVPLTRFGNNYTTTASSGGEGQGVSTHVPVTITNCRSGGSFVAFLTGILGDVQNAEVEFSVDGGTNFSTCSSGVQFSINAGTFRPYTLIYSDSLTFSGSNQTAVFRVRFNGKKNYTQLGLTVLVDNTN